MTKEEKFRAIHKVLHFKEDWDKGKVTEEVFYKVLTNCYVKISGAEFNDNNLKDNTITTLKGLRETYSELSYKDMRTILLGLMGDIDRGDE